MTPQYWLALTPLPNKIATRRIRRHHQMMRMEATKMKRVTVRRVSVPMKAIITTSPQSDEEPHPNKVQMRTRKLMRRKRFKKTRRMSKSRKS